jgi:hypothetical protein
MNRTVRVKLSENVKDESGCLFATNEDNEVYISLRQIEQFSFGKNTFRYVLSSFDIDGCAVITFGIDGMGEYHRIKREVESYMGLPPKDSSKKSDPISIPNPNSEVNIDML